MTTPWKKAMRDFWREKARTACVIMAIALGITAFSTVLSSYAILTRELDEGYLATNPASATLRLRSVSDELISSILTGHGVAEAEPRRAVTGRLRAGPAEWRNLTLFVVKDYGRIRVSKVNPERGAWPPGAGEILIERDAMQVAKTRIGERVTVKTSRGKEAALRVSGIVHDVGQAQARMENVVYGYIVLDTLAQLGEDPFLDQIKIVVDGDRLDESKVRRVTADLQLWLESQGHSVLRVDVPVPGKHPHSDIMGLLMLSMSSFGIFALVLSGILVVNLLTALMAAQIRQIGMMKAVGGTRSQIAAIYLGQTALMGLGALAVALPAGWAGCRVLCRYMAVFLNFDIHSFSIPPWVYLLDAAVGLAAPLLAAARPVWRGTRITVHHALADTGITSSNFGAGLLDGMLLGIDGLARPILLSIRNSFRRRARLLLTVVTLAAAGLFFFSALNVRSSLIRTLDKLFDTRKFDLTVTLSGMYPYDQVSEALHDIGGVAAFEGWITVEGVIPAAERAASSGNLPLLHTTPGTGGMHGSVGAGPAGERFAVIARPEQTTLLQMDIIEGRDLRPNDENAMVINNALAERRKLKVGSEVTLQVGPSLLAWRIVGLAQEPFSPATAYISRQFLERRGGHDSLANSLRLKLEDRTPAAIAAVKEELDRRLEKAGFRALGSVTKADSRFGFDQHMVMIYVFLMVMSGILGAVGGLGLMTTMSLNVQERRREMGVLRAIGASPSAVRLMVVAEAWVIAAMGWAAGALAAWPAGRAVADILVGMIFRSRIAYQFEWIGLPIWLVVSLLLGAVASFLPAWHAARRPVREAISYE